VVALAGILAATTGDIIAIRTGLGRLLFGTILLAAGNSLPELVTAFGAVRLGIPDLAAGNILGGAAIAIFFLGLLDLVTPQMRLLHSVAIRHSLTASLATLMISATTFFILVPLGWQWGYLDLEGLILLALFVGGARLIQLNARLAPAPPPVEEPASRLSLGWAFLGFAGAIALLILATPTLVEAAETLAEITGVGAGFIGLALLSLVTNIPDLASSIAAVRLGAFDLAVGSLFGSCVFRVAALALVSLFYPGSLFAAISPGFVVVGLLALILINTALLGTLARPEWRLGEIRIEWDAILIILIYLAGLYLLYRQGLLLPAHH